MGKVLAVVWWAWIPLCWQPLWSQAPRVGVESGHKPKQQTKLGTSNASTDQKGTEKSPLVVEIQNRPKNPEDAAKEKREKDRKYFVDTWTLYLTGSVAAFTGLLVLVGLGGVIAALRTLRAIERQAKLMDTEVALVHRAYLRLGKVDSPVDDQATFPIENTGTVPARMTSIDVQIIALIANQAEPGNWNEKTITDYTIVPGKTNAFSLSVVFPKNASDQVVFSVKVEYDTGFRSSDVLQFVRVYSKTRFKWMIASEFATVDPSRSRDQDEQNAN